MRPKGDLHLDYSELKIDKFDGPKTKKRRDNAKRQSNSRRRKLDKEAIEEFDM